MKEKKKIWIIDSTLRDGLQAPGIELTYPQRLQLAEELALTGVNELEAGVAAAGQEELEFLKELQWNMKGVRITPWARARQEDLLALARTGLDSIHISFPLSPLQLKLYQRDWNWVQMQMKLLGREALQRFSHVSFGAMDASRTPLKFLKSFVHLSRKMGVHRVRLADTVGTLLPDETEKLFRKLSHPGEMTLEFHGHNDMGLALANSLAALKGGAGALSLTLNGIGERAGNTALEQVAALLPARGDYTCSLKRERLQKLSSLLRQFTGPLGDRFLPIVGDQVFTHESGIHGQAMIRDQRSFCQLDPGEYGRNHQYRLGNSSGSSLMQHLLEDQGIQTSREEARFFLLDLKKAFTEPLYTLQGEKLSERYRHWTGSRQNRRREDSLCY